jgi:hypothetical protein
MGMVPFSRPISPPGHCDLDKHMRRGSQRGITWNSWKEKNRRIFNSVHKNELQVALSTKEDIELYHQALRDPLQ